MAEAGYAAGLDVGGTKIAARVFDSTWNTIRTRDVATPTESYADLLDAITAEIHWLCEWTGQGTAPVGIGLPGIVDARSGTVLTANLPASGRSLRQDLANRLAGLEPTIVNDCRAFALSEAVLGAGQGHETVLGLVIGTGLAGGLVWRGRLMEGAQGAAGEFGHMPVSAQLVARHQLPILPCGCGREGCYETLCSGPGLLRIAKQVTGRDVDATAFAAPASQMSPDLQRCRTIWIDLLAELVTSLCLTFDPDCVVLGGGASKASGLVPGLLSAMDKKRLTAMKLPHISLAQGGPASGARGAALAAVLARKAGK